MRIFYDTDASLDSLRGKKIGIIGYGSQGHAQAQNLRDSGLQVTVAARPGSPTYEQAVEDGFTPVSAREAAEKSDIIQILIPDHAQAAIYRQDIAPWMKAGKTLLFSHGFNIHYGQIIPPKEVDMVMVAPKGPRTPGQERIRARSGRAGPCRHSSGRIGSGPSRRLWHMRRVSAQHGPGSLKPPLRKKPKRTFSASRPSFVAGYPN